MNYLFIRNCNNDEENLMGGIIDEFKYNTLGEKNVMPFMYNIWVLRFGVLNIEK